MKTDELQPAHRAFLLICETEGVLTSRNPIPETAILTPICNTAKTEAEQALKNGSVHAPKTSFPVASTLADALLAVESPAAIGRPEFRRLLTLAEAWRNL